MTVIYKRGCDPRAHDARLYKGGGGSQQNPTTNTTNTDARAAVQDGVAVTGDGSSANVIFEQSDPDAVKAIAAAGAQTMQNVGGAIVDMNRDTVQANSKSFDTLVQAGAAMVDKMIDANTAATERAVAAYRPVDGANADVAKWGTVAAAAGLVAALLLRGK